MKTITEAIFDLLFVRDTVVVPGLGAFVKKPTPANVNRVANYFTAPSSVIEFDDKLRDDNDLIINYIVEENNVSLDEARRLLAIFVSDCFSVLKEGKSVTLDGIGSLRYDWNFDIVLDQDTSSNFNSDSFGLCDFSVTHVDHFATKDEIKAEIEQQQKDKNTPVTVDEKAVHEDDDEDKEEYYKNYRWRVRTSIVQILLFIIAIVFALQYFNIIDFKEWLWPQDPVYFITDSLDEPEKPHGVGDTIVMSESEVDTVIPVVDTVIPVETDTLVRTDSLNHEPEQKVVPTGEAKILIVAGCFSSEENAHKLETKLKDRGYQSACVEMHGGKWFVSYGRYCTDDEAKAALAKIKADGEAKAWIRK